MVAGKPSFEESKEDVRHADNIKGHGHVVAEVKGENVALAAAVGQSHMKLTDKNTIKLLSAMLVAFCCCSSQGFDGSIMGSINAMPQYLAYFHYSSVGAKTGLVFALYTIGSLVAGLGFGNGLSDYVGRRRAMAVGGLLVWLGTGIIAGAVNEKMFLAGRFICGFGTQLGYMSAPAYCTEVAPPQWRGRVVGMFHSVYFFGQILSTGIAAGSVNLQSSWAWRLPLLVQAGPAAIVIFGHFFIPESPRWLYAKGRKEEARAFFVKYHGNDDATSPLVQLQIREVEETVIPLSEATPFYDWRVLFRDHNTRYRTHMAMIMAWFGQLSGNGLVSYFGPELYKIAGITSAQQQLILTFVNAVTSFIGATIGSMSLDHVGRRPILIWGTASLVITLAITTACSAEYFVSPQVANTGVAFIFLFQIFFSFTYTSLQALYPTECLSFEIRTKGYALYTIVSNIAGIINTYGISVALANIGWKTYIIFVVWDVVEVIWLYLFAVETKGRTLEELDEIFQSRTPVKTSLSKHQAVVLEDGAVQETAVV